MSTRGRKNVYLSLEGKGGLSPKIKQESGIRDITQERYSPVFPTLVSYNYTPESY